MQPPTLQLTSTRSESAGTEGRPFVARAVSDDRCLRPDRFVVAHRPALPGGLWPIYYGRQTRGRVSVRVARSSVGVVLASVRALPLPPKKAALAQLALSLPELPAATRERLVAAADLPPASFLAISSSMARKVFAAETPGGAIDPPLGGRIAAIFEKRACLVATAPRFSKADGWVGTQRKHALLATRPIGDPPQPYHGCVPRVRHIAKDRLYQRSRCLTDVRPLSSSD